MRNLRYGLQEKSAHRFNTLVDILSKIARKVSKTREFKLNQQALINNCPDKVFNATNCGDNCAKWLLKIAEKKDVTINLRYLMDFGKGPFDIMVLNAGRIVHTGEELLLTALDYVSGGN